MLNLCMNFQELTNFDPKVVVIHPLPLDQKFSECIYDSRIKSEGSIFFAIKGYQVDGHDFIPNAIENGATLIIVDDSEKAEFHHKNHPQIGFLFYPSVLEFLQNLAVFYRSKFKIPVAAVTGSSGKTTTKDLCSAILKLTHQALTTEGSLNNHWGVPQTVMRLRDNHKTSVFELGTSGFGEISRLSEICQPSIGYITTIGESHLETLKDDRGVLKAKRELFDWIVKNSHEKNQLLFNIDHPLLLNLYEEFKSKKNSNLSLFTISLNNPSADFFVNSKKQIGYENRFGYAYEFKTPFGKIQGKLPLPGLHNLMNALGATALALLTGVAKPEHVIEGLENPKLSKLRSNLFKSSLGCLVLDDSYNANPTSVRALFESASDIKNQGSVKRVIAVMGDMLELGDNSDLLHEQMGELCAKLNIDALFAVGKGAEFWVKGFRGRASGTAHFFSDQESLFSKLKAELHGAGEDTLVLVKGSRGSKMDLIVKKLV